MTESDASNAMKESKVATGVCPRVGFAMDMI